MTVDSRGGGVGTASLHFQHFPAMWKCQLSVARYSDFKGKAGNENVCVKSPIIFKHWHVFKKKMQTTVGRARCICGWNDVFRLPVFDLSRCKVPQSAGTILALLIIFAISSWNDVWCILNICWNCWRHLWPLNGQEPIIYSLNKYFKVILLLYHDLAPFLFFFLSQPWVTFYANTLQQRTTLNSN